MSTQPVQNLEHRAAEQRRQIHATADELKGKIYEVREKFDFTSTVREHRFAVAITIGIACLLMSTAIARRYKR